MTGASHTAGSPADTVAALLAALTLSPLGGDRFEARCAERARRRTFGGELLAQTLVAAGRTADARTCHSLHAHFLAAGHPASPIEYRVHRVRDGRRFAQRRVSAWQRDRELLVATVSFATEDADAGGYQDEAMPDVPGPEGLATELALRQAVADRMRPEDRAWLLTPRAVEVRQVHPVPLFDPPPVAPVARTWIRAIDRLPDDPLLHRAVLAYASDMTLLDIAAYPHGLAWIDPRIEQTSLDHAMFFHRAFRVDEWLLYVQAVPVAAGGRAFARGSVFTRAGALVASVVQEGLSRLRP